MPASQTLGSTLRLARERKGVTLAEAQQATKVRQAFLAALENDDYSTLPPSVYVRGFIKNYAGYLGLDPQNCVQSFDEMLEAIAAGYEPYYGSTDSGGKGVHPAEHSQLLSGLSQGEARLVEHGPESLAAQPLPVAKPLEEQSLGQANSVDEPNDSSIPEEVDITKLVQDEQEVKALTTVGSYGPTGLRPYEKYVLRPAIQPISKPSLYIPNFVPFLLVLIIVGAACLLAYRGLVMPKTDEQGKQSTATPSFDVAATPTAAGLGIFDNGTTPGATKGSVITPPPFFTPINTATSPVEITSAPSTAKPVGQVAAPGSAASINTPTANAPPTANIAAQPTSIQPTATPVGPTSTPTLDPNAIVTIEVSVSQTSSWLGVVVDGESKFAKYLYSTDAPLVFSGKRIEVRAGNPDVVLIKVNGASKPYTVPRSGIITHIYNADGTDAITK